MYIYLYLYYGRPRCCTVNICVLLFKPLARSEKHERYASREQRPPGGVRENGNVERFSRISGRTTQFSGEHSRECRGVFPVFTRRIRMGTTVLFLASGATFKPTAPQTYFGSAVTLKDLKNVRASRGKPHLPLPPPATTTNTTNTTTSRPG